MVTFLYFFPIFTLNYLYIPNSVSSFMGNPLAVLPGIVLNQRYKSIWIKLNSLQY